MSVMPEHFQSWKDKALPNVIDTAWVLEQYVRLKKTLLEIDNELANTQSELFISLDSRKVRSSGTALFFQLHMRELLKQLPADSFQTLRDTLTKLGTIFSLLNDSPIGNRDKISDLITLTKQLVALDDSHFADKKQIVALFFSLYTTLKILELSLDSLPWLIRKLFSNLGRTVSELLIQTKARMQLHSEVNDTLVAVPNTLSPIQNHFNQYYCENKEALISDKLKQLEAEVDRVSKDISTLISLKHDTTAIQSELTPVNNLFLAVNGNDQLVVGRKYFLDLIKEHRASYDILLQGLHGDKKNQFMQKVEQLKQSSQSPVLSSRLITGLSWVALPATIIYRKMVPRIVQELVSISLPATVDSACKADLKEFAWMRVLQLRKEKQDRAALKHQLFAESDALKQFMLKQSTEELTALNAAIDSVKGSLQIYQRVRAKIEDDWLVLSLCKNGAEILGEFICIHDGFFVALSNFFAQFFSIFKTETAIMIDEAVMWQKKIIALETQYNNDMAQHISNIEADESLSGDIKDQLKTQLVENLPSVPVEPRIADKGQAKEVMTFFKSAFGGLGDAANVLDESVHLQPANI